MNENGIFKGLKRLQEGGREGIKALKASAGIGEGPVGCGTVGFVLAPRLNAVGRLADAENGVKLLVTSSFPEARRIAAELESLNKERQQIEMEILQDVEKKIGKEVDLEKDPCIVLSSTEWHLGVIGIVRQS